MCFFCRSHQDPFLSHFIRALRDNSKNKTQQQKQRNASYNVSSMFSQRKIHINHDQNEVQHLIISQHTSQNESTTILKGEKKRKKNVQVYTKYTQKHGHLRILNE